MLIQKIPKMVIARIYDVIGGYYNKPVVDWTGNWTAGTLTLPGLSQCSRIEINDGYLGPILTSYACAGTIYAGGGSTQSESQITIIRFYLPLSGDTLTYKMRLGFHMDTTSASNGFGGFSGPTATPITRIRAWRV